MIRRQAGYFYYLVLDADDLVYAQRSGGGRSRWRWCKGKGKRGLEMDAEEDGLENTYSVHSTRTIIILLNQNHVIMEQVAASRGGGKT